MMKIALFGSTGRVGAEILKRALGDGHAVTVLVRSPEKLVPHEKLTIIQGDVFDEKAVAQAIVGVDVVCSALGTDKTTTLTEAITPIIRDMKLNNIKRIVTIGTAGILQSRVEEDKLRYESSESKRRLTFAAAEHHKVYDLLRESNLDWTIVCPTYLPDGEAVGEYRVLRNLLPEDAEKISVGDTAQFAYGELINGQHIGFRVGISY